MKFFTLPLQALVMACLLIFSTQTWSSDFFDETFGNLQEDLETAAEDGKKGIFIFFHMEECPFCHRMKTTILNEPDVVTYFKEHFLAFEIDIEGANELIDFDGTVGTSQSISEKKYRVRATPVMMVFDLQGKPLLKYTGPTRTKQEFMWMGEYVVEGAYKETSFTRYKRAKKRALRQ